MKFRLSALAIALALPAFAQDPVASARSELKKAVGELTTTQREYADLRRSLYRDINKLDDEALNLGKELKSLQREEERRTATEKTLEREIEARKTEFDYASGILNQYSKALLTRLHPAENQRFRGDIEKLDQQAVSAADEPTQELARRLKALELGIDRLSQVAGGLRFQGKALRNGSESIDGSFFVAGPSVFFAADMGGFAGVGTFAETGTSLPTVVSLKSGGDDIAETLKNGSGTLPFDGSMGKAIEVAAAEESLWETIEKGGIVGHAILLLGAISLLIAAIKVWSVSRLKVPSLAQVNAVIDDLLADRRESAIRKASDVPGVGGALLLTGAKHFHEKRRVLEEALFEKLMAIKPKLDSFLPFLALTAAAGPLMGLLGTVLGIIKTFKAMALYGTGNAKNFSAGISEALITTAEGLVVAIPVLVIHGLLKSYTKGKYSEFESVAISLMNGTTELERRGASKAASPSEPADEDDTDLAPTLA